MLFLSVVLYFLTPILAENESLPDESNHAKLVHKARINILSNIFRKRLEFFKNDTIKEVELIFLIDGSSSVGDENFQNELKFVKKLIAGFIVGPHAARVAVTVFGSDIITYVNHLDSKVDYEKCSLLQIELPKIQYPGGNTFTLAALENAIFILNQTRPNARKAVFLITDGFSNNGDPVPAAAQLKRTGVKLFTFGIKSGNVEELRRISSPPFDEYCYLLESFLDFEALARRALHYDLPPGVYTKVSDQKLCSRLCDEGSCCNENTTCSCGSFSGHFSCLCPPGYYGSGSVNTACLPCPKGTYNEGLVPGDSTVCRQCPDRNQKTKKYPALGIDDCICKDGFVPVGEKCAVVTCSALEPPKNGYFVKEYCSNVLNAACGVRCDIGYVLNGSSVRICQKNGIWTGVEPKCMPKKCDALKPVSNGEVVCSHEDEGYEVFLKFGENGEKKKEIIKTKPMEAGKLKEGFIVDTECAFRCPEGFSLVGSKLRTCLPVTRWNGLQTACRPITCLSLPKITNGEINPKNCTQVGIKHFYGTTCEITCKPGYSLKGNQTLQCTERRGLWSGKSHSYKCIDVEPPQLRCPENMTLNTIADEAFTIIKNFSLPMATDNSGVDPIIWTQPSIDEMKLWIGRTEIEIFGSDASGNVANCSFWVLVQDSEQPVVENCQSPEPMTLAALLQLNWEEPVFSDNSGNVTVEKSQQVTGVTNGTTIVTYKAQDPSGNFAICAVNLTLLDNICMLPPMHRNTEVTCSSNDAETKCLVYCKTGFTSLTPNVTLICKEAEWIYPISASPDCSETVFPDKVTEYGEIVVDDDTNICNTDDNVSFITNQISNERINLKIECSKEGIEEESNTIWNPSRNRRSSKRKRKINFMLTVESSKPLPDLSENELFWSYFGTTNRQIENFERIVQCQFGSIPIGKTCAKCPIGTFYLNEKCHVCAVGFYQDEEGQSMCKPCPSDFSTLLNKSASITHCRRICRTGNFGLRVNINGLGLSPCRRCPSGQFQPQRGQTTCIPCTQECNNKKKSCSCHNNGACFEDKCLCPDGYLGTFCDKTFNFCDSSPCLNGGSCIGSKTSFFCQCPNGFNGKFCEIKIDPCLSSPCQNGGTCVNERNGFTCECLNHFFGKFCSDMIDMCAITRPCLNNGVCTLLKNDEFKCSCVGEYSGRYCERFDNCLPEEEWFCSKINGSSCMDEDCSPSNHTNSTHGKSYDLNSVLIFPKCSATDYVMMDLALDFDNFSICLWVMTADNFNFGTLFSYATHSNDNEFTLTDYNGFVLYVKGERIVTDIVANDGLWHFLCVTRKSKDGSWAIFLDGVQHAEGFGLGGNLPLEAGKLVIGQEQDYFGGGFNEVESFVGKITRVEIWPRILTREEIQILRESCNGTVMPGIEIWEQILMNIRGNIQIMPSNFCNDCGPSPLIFRSDVINKGNVAEYRCKDGFLMKFPYEDTHTSLQNWTRKCLKTGEWEPNSPLCTRVNCGIPGFFLHGTIIGRSHLFEDTIRYQCNENYTLLGSSIRKCQSNGQWSGETPTCQDILGGRGCQPVSAPRRGSLFLLSKTPENIAVRDKAEFTCDNGYYLIGSSILTCLPNGKWDNFEPTCSLCPQPQLPTNIVMKNYKDKIELHCLNTNQIIIVDCVMGSWNIPQKFCRNFDELCPTPKPPKHGYWITHTRSINDKYIGDVIYFACRHGYKLTGSNAVVCVENKTWNITENSCQPIKCGIPKEPENALITDKNFSDYYGEILSMECKIGFVSSEPPTMRCEANGQWSGNRGKFSVVTMNRFDLQGAKILFSDTNPFDRSYHNTQKTFDLEIIKLLCVIMNATAEIVKNPLITDLMVYEKTPNAWIVEQLVHGTAEVSSASLVLTPDSNNRIAYSVAIGTFRPQIYFKEHSVRMANNIYYIPFSQDTWIALFCLLLSITVVLTFILSRETRLPHSTPYDIIARIADEKHEKGINWDKIDIKSADNIGKREHWEISEILLVSIGALCQQGSERDPSTAAARTLLLALFVLAVVTYTAYSASVISIISLLPNTDIELHMGWAAAKNSSIILHDTNFFKHSFDPSNQKVDYKSLEIGLEAALKGQAVFVADRDVSLTVLHQLRFGPELRCSLGRAFPGLEYQRVFALRRKSPYLQQINYNILRLRQYGLLTRERKRVYDRRLPCSLKERAALSGFVSVDLSDTLPALKLLFIGCALAILIILIEFVLFYCSMEIRNTFGKSWQKVEDRAGKILDGFIERNKKTDFRRKKKLAGDSKNLTKPRQFLH